jgi:hypothetical protein
MTAVLDELVQAPLPAPELSVVENLRWVLERVSDVLTHGLGPGGGAAVLADSDPEFTLALRTRIADHLRPLTDVMAADITLASWPPTSIPTHWSASCSAPTWLRCSATALLAPVGRPQRRSPPLRHHARQTGIVRGLMGPAPHLEPLSRSHDLE